MDKFLKKYKNNKTLNFFDKLLYRLKENDITSYGAGLAFFLILSIFPFLIALINIVNFLDIINVDNILNLMQYFPNSVKEIVKNFFIELNITSSTELLSISVLAGLFSASSAINKLIKFINNSYGFEDNRNFFLNRVLAIIFTLLFIFMILLLIVSQVFGKIIFYKFISIFQIDSKIIYFLWIIANSLIPLIYLFLTFSAVYRFAPCPPKNDKIKYKTVIPGSLFSTFAVIIATVIFAFYVNNFGKYSITYGSLGGIIVFLIWLFLLSTLILIGAEINIVLYSIKKGNHEENRKDTIIYK
ncbi:YihY/virulence factor BrkB family protein [Peptoniphilus sp.]|uniref:YihY/virulence factor BrkB family protein n=1 Tax=Peptoniphilus sp. TaxID=1971214 RepID=UPI00399419AB